MNVYNFTSSVGHSPNLLLYCPGAAIISAVKISKNERLYERSASCSKDLEDLLGLVPLRSAEASSQSIFVMFML